MGINFWHYVEIVVIIIVIIYQIIHTIKVYVNISKLKKTFTFKLFLRDGFIDRKEIGKIDFKEKMFTPVEGEDIIKLSLVDTEGINDTITTIKVAINTYLINNYGAAVNFSIIKDIVDREIEVKDEEISQSVTLPLYLGLTATMVGIIFGLLSMSGLSGNENDFLADVNALIGGVKIAMFGSLAGLLCTTYLSSFSYKEGKRTVQKDKNEQLTYLQAKLLPELVKAEDTGVSGLKASLDRFARVATNISDDVLIAADQTGKNLELQKELMEKVDNMKILKVSKWNIELFDKMDNSMEALNQFSSYLSNMERISSQLLEFSNKTSDVNRVINGIDSTLVESRDLTRFLSSHFEKIENSGDAALKSVGITEAYFEEAILSLGKRTEEMINQLYKSAGSHESKLESIYKEIEENLNSITSQYVSAFEKAYSEAIPKFNQLDNLELMKGMNESIDNIKQNKDLISKLNSIEDLLKERSKPNENPGKASDIGNTPEKKETNPKDTISLGQVFKNIF